MDITKEQIDDLNAIVKVIVHKTDYHDSVEKVLKDYRKQANVPGFRKGHVPLGLVRKQYGTAVTADEVSKLLQKHLDQYLIDEKIDILGQPLPIANENIDWTSDDLEFEFELGLAPSFEVKLKTKKAVTRYKIVADKKTIEEQLTHIRKQSGTLISKEEVGKNHEVTGTFTHEAEEIDNKTTIELDQLHKKAVEILMKQKPGTSVTLATKTLFKENYDLAIALDIPQEIADELDIDVNFTIEAINERQHAALDQDLFDTLYPNGEVTSEKELRQKIKEDYEAQFQQITARQFLDDYTDKLIEETKFDLPLAFLQKWIQESGKEPISETAAKDILESAERGFRYQLIEGKLIEEHQIQPKFEELKAFAKKTTQIQMRRFGMRDVEEERLDALVGMRLSNEEEVRRLSKQLIDERLLTLFEEKANLKNKEVTYEKYLKETQDS